MELVVAKLLFAGVRLTGSRKTFTGQFERERDRVLSLVNACDGEMGATRVLIKRLPGMEDSSRYWSVWMTLDHLRIVHHTIASAIQSLGQGIIFKQEARTELVKPSPEATATSLEAFQRSCALVLKRAAELPDLKTPLRYAHPWFGQLNAEGWYAMAGFHLKLHRRQIELIVRAAGKGGAATMR